MSREKLKKMILDTAGEYSEVASAYLELVDEGKLPDLHTKKKEIDLKDLRSQINELPRYVNRTRSLIPKEIETVDYRGVVRILDGLEEEEE